jgi:short-subunit dehydrogenase
MNLRGRTAVVTGASSGIGRAVALECARRGASVVLGARRLERLEVVAAECRSKGVRADCVATDVTVPGDCQRLVARALELHGRIDILINNAGFATFDPIEEATPADLELMMETNYFGAVRCTQAALPHMLAAQDGCIVNVASIAGLMGYARMGGYCATKFALVGFSESLHDEVAGRGIRVSCVCPGTTNTEFFEKAERGKMPGASRLILAVSPERVARAVCNAAESGSYRKIIPFPAHLFMRLKELAPRLAHLVMRRVSGVMENR